jgi:hypothetical protein
MKEKAEDKRVFSEDGSSVPLVMNNEAQERQDTEAKSG